MHCAIFVHVFEQDVDVMKTTAITLAPCTVVYDYVITSTVCCQRQIKRMYFTWAVEKTVYEIKDDYLGLHLGIIYLFYVTEHEKRLLGTVK